MSLNFSISELVKSDIAKNANINNTPSLADIDNLLNLIYYCLQPIRDRLGRPMIITSGYRCAKLNALVKGKTNSQHLKGQAVDFHVNGLTINQVINLIIKYGIEYDQLINEYDKWVHISFVKGKNRKQPPFKIS